ncbi:MAG: hypothetical protein M9962_07380 [Oligoflexia bacterium]|nr:hypothetical protein [Oligoflexia bacterium]
MKLTEQIRFYALIMWSLGLSAVMIDSFSFSIVEERASFSYLFFIAAFLLLAWAEKRQYSTRVYIYRIHDIVIYSPLKYFLIYFLWVSLFSPFTENPIKSILFALNGWLSLFTVAVSAHLLFCERSSDLISLLPKQFSFSFKIFNLILCFIFINLIFHLFFPQLPFPQMIRKQFDLFLFFIIGLPFLIWDLLKMSRKFANSFLVATNIILGLGLITLLSSKIFYLGPIFAIFLIICLTLYKRVKQRKALIALLVISSASIGVPLLFITFGPEKLLRIPELLRVQQVIETKLLVEWKPAFANLLQSKFMGSGIGVVEGRGVWARVLVDSGVIGFLLYLCFYGSLAKALLLVRRSSRVVASNVALISLLVFIVIVSHFLDNPYSAWIWVWYAIWTVLGSTHRKKDLGVSR